MKTYQPRRSVRITSSDVVHVIQRPIDVCFLLYDIKDRIVLYTTIASYAKIYGVVVAAASFMFTHLHLSLIVLTEIILELFQHDWSISFAKSYNCRYSRKGELFEKPFGRSVKRTDKDIRSNIAYVNNNHVEKKLVGSCRNSRWDFVPYAYSKYPFSKPLDKSSSKELRRFFRLINRRAKANKPLTYADCDRMFSKLSSDELEQLIDHIISTYALVDFSQVEKRFGSMDNMVNALRSMTGNEYGIKEDHSQLSDVGYEEILKTLPSDFNISEIYNLPYEERISLAKRCACRCRNVRDKHLVKFFRISENDLWYH